MHPDVKLAVDQIATGPSFEGGMSILTLAHSHIFLSPPTDAEGVFRLRTLVSSLDAIASRAENKVAKEAA